MVSATWYSENGRVIATTIGTASMPLGAAIGYIIPAFFVTDTDSDGDRSVAQKHITYSLIF